jgi:anti-sigma regulatory factor (Ser/Thr protein kinase)
MNSAGLAHTYDLSAQPARARQELQSLLESAGWRGDVEAVVLAVHEAIMNSMRHAGGATSATAGLAGADLVVEVRDGGPGFDVDEHSRRAPDPLAECGRGLWLITQIAASWKVERRDGETCLRLCFQG